jgi:hypothetical protein
MEFSSYFSVRKWLQDRIPFVNFLLFFCICVLYIDIVLILLFFVVVAVAVAVVVVVAVVVNVWNATRKLLTFTVFLIVDL